MHLDNKFKIFNIIFYSFIVFLLLYSFDYSFGWGLNLISPDVYFFTLGTGNNGYNPYVWNENGLIEFFQVLIIISSLIILINIIFKKSYSNLIKTLITIQFQILIIMNYYPVIKMQS